MEKIEESFWNNKILSKVLANYIPDGFLITNKDRLKLGLAV